MTQELIQLNIKDNIAYLTLNSPEKLNVLSEEMIHTLLAILSEIETNPNIKCAVIGANGKAFCAGHDLSELSASGFNGKPRKDYFKHLFDLCSSLMVKINQIPIPIIASVQGAAVAAGCQLVATCDLAVAAKSAKFGVNGVNIGLFCSTPMVALTRNIPTKIAFELLTTGKIIDANYANQIGLVNRVCPDEKLRETTMEFAQIIASKLTSAVKIGKKAFYEQANMTLDDAYKYAGEVMETNLLFRDTQEGINAFLEKRQPNWKQ